MKESYKIAVIAGTPVDTAMGVDYLKRNEETWEILGYPVSSTPQEQMNFQISDTENRESVIGAILRDGLEKGVDGFFVYCNSLSASVDFNKLAELFETAIVTPLMFYEETGGEYGRIAVIAANNKSLAGIEEAVLKGNSDAEVIGTALMPVVKMVEAGYSPEIISEKGHLKELAAFFEKTGCEALVLGCTHFPCFGNEIKNYSSLTVIDPADGMLEKLRRLIG